MENLFDLREKYLSLSDYGEENIKIKIVKPLIELLGFKEEWQQFEHPVIKGKRYTDISIVRNGKLEFIIEVKKGGNYKISHTDKHQLLSYLMEKNVEWGIITNGEIMYLLNYKINAETKYREVLCLNLLDESTYSIFEYLSWDSIFSTHKTNYFKHLSQFTNYFRQENDNYNTWNIYYSTIYSYFKYLIRNYDLYRELEYLNLADFKGFISMELGNDLKGNKVLKTKSTVINKFRYIKKMYELFVKNKEISKNPFDFIKESDILSGISNLKFGDDVIVNDISLEMITEYYNLIGSENHRDNTSERNKIICGLCFYAGLTRDEIRNIKIGNINQETKTLIVNGVEIPLHDKLFNKIINYIELHLGDNKKDGHFLFATNRNKFENVPLTKELINLVYTNVNKIENNNLKLNFIKIRNVLIRNLFDSGFTIDEIITITRTDIKIIANMIDTEEIIERTSIGSLASRHPFKPLFDALEL